jgi:hypothetical protein
MNIKMMRFNFITIAVALASFVIQSSYAGGAAPVLVLQFDDPHCRGKGQHPYISPSSNVCDPFGSGDYKVRVTEIATGKLVEQDLRYLFYFCEHEPKPFAAFGGSDQAFIACPKEIHKPLDAFCFAYYDNGEFLFAEQARCFPCRPSSGITKSHCSSLVRKCRNLVAAIPSINEQETDLQIRMKWCVATIIS